MIDPALNPQGTVKDTTYTRPFLPETPTLRDRVTPPEYCDSE